MRGSLIRPLVERIKNVSVMHILGGFIGVKGGGVIIPKHIEICYILNVFFIYNDF